MEIEKVTDQDQDKLVQLAGQYDFPVNLSNTFAHRTAKEDGKIIGFGWLQLIVEANILLNIKDRRKFEALKKILEHGKFDAKKAGFDQVHAFPKDPKFSSILKKHYGFSDVTGDSLVMNLE